jgi:flagellin
MFNHIGTELNRYGAASNYVDMQQSYNSNKIDAMNSGLGSLIDADLTKESAQLQALVRQQLGTQALSLANQAPQTLLSLFK